MADLYEQRKQKLQEEQSNYAKEQEEGKIKINNRIESARKTQQQIKNIVKSTSVKGVFSNLRKIRIIKDIPFFAAIGAGLLKDILDYAGIGSLPLIGWIITGCISIFIVMMMILAGNRSKYKAAKSLGKKFFVLIAGTSFEAFFTGVNLIPVETVMAGLVYYMDLSERSDGDEGESGDNEEDYDMAA